MNFSDKIKFQREQNHLTRKNLQNWSAYPSVRLQLMKVPAPSHESLLWEKHAHAYQIPYNQGMSEKRAEYEDFSSWKHQETMIFEIENFKQNCIINLK